MNLLKFLNRYCNSITTNTDLTLKISLLSGKAVYPLVWNPHITVSWGQLTKGPHTESLLGRFTIATTTQAMRKLKNQYRTGLQLTCSGCQSRRPGRSHLHIWSWPHLPQRRPPRCPGSLGGTWCTPDTPGGTWYSWYSIWPSFRKSVALHSLSECQSPNGPWWKEHL